MRISQLTDLFLNVLSPLVLGVVIYWAGNRVPMPMAVRNYLPDGLWAYSLMSAILVIWQRRIVIGWVLAVFALSIGFETLQYFHWIAGTGDLYDILTYFIFFGISLTINSRYEKPQKTSRLFLHFGRIRPAGRLFQR